MSSGGGGGGRVPNLPPAPNVAINKYKFKFRDRDRFNGQHFDIWMIHVRTILQELQLWEVVTGAKPKPAATAAPDVIKAWEFKDLKPGMLFNQHWISP